MPDNKALQDFVAETDPEGLRKAQELEFESSFNDDSKQFEQNQEEDNSSSAESKSPAEEAPVIIPPTTEVDPKDEIISQLEARIRKNEGSFGTLNSKYLAINEELKANKEVIKKAPTPEQYKAAIENEATWNEFQEEWPEHSAAINAQMSITEKKLMERLPNTDGFISAQQAGQMVSDAVEMVKLDISQPGWETKVATKEFTGWLDAQDVSLQALAASDRPSDALALLARYDVYSNSKQGGLQPNKIEIEAQRKKNSLAASIPPTNSRGGAKKPISGNLTKEQEFERAFNS